MNQEELLEVVAEVLEVDSVELSDDLEDRGWDSLATLTFIAEIDERTGISIDADTLSDAKLVSDLLPLVTR